MRPPPVLMPSGISVRSSREDQSLPVAGASLDLE